MRSRANIVRQLEHFKEQRCNTDEPTRITWIAALEWVLQEGLVLRPEFADMSAFGQLVMAAMAARNGLRSYQYGNVATELAAEIADELDRVIPPALEERGRGIDALKGELAELDGILNELRASLTKTLTEGAVE